MTLAQETHVPRGNGGPVAFHKYSSHGNHFVVVDELDSAMLDEPSKAAFARWATDAFAGIGADNVVFIQPFTMAVLSEIQRAHAYWHQYPHPEATPHAVIRFYEPDGGEFMTCGNALLCVAKHLHDFHKVGACEVLVEVPQRRPRVSAISYDAASSVSVLELRPDSSRIDDFIGDAFPGTRHLGMHLFSGLAIDLTDQELRLAGAVVYAGEPHLVLLQTHGSAPPPRWPKGIPFDSSHPDFFGSNDAPDTAAMLDATGRYLNWQMPGAFPRGINVGVLRTTTSAGVLEYRCFERGLFRETLACGTGALAVHMVASRLGMVDEKRTTLIGCVQQSGVRAGADRSHRRVVAE